jgi:hypothetical protein
MNASTDGHDCAMKAFKVYEAQSLIIQYIMLTCLARLSGQAIVADLAFPITCDD